MSTHNIGFYEDLTKIIFELSSNTHLISSAVHICTPDIVKFLNVGMPTNFTVNTLKVKLRGSTMV